MTRSIKVIETHTLGNTQLRIVAIRGRYGTNYRVQRNQYGGGWRNVGRVESTLEEVSDALNWHTASVQLKSDRA